MQIETLKYYIQSANINFLYGSGLSKPYLATLGNIEKWLTDLNEEREKHGKQVEYTIVEASILKEYFETVMLPNVNPTGTEYDNTKAEYRRFLSAWNDIINNRCNKLVGKQVNMFTTNVDMMMERASLGYGVELNDGFQGSIEQEYDAGNFQKTVRKTSLHFQNVTDIPVFNLMKIHGSINWREEDDIIKNDIGLTIVNSVNAALADVKHFVTTTKPSGEEKTLVDMVDEAKKMKLADDTEFKPFLDAYRKMVMINPTKRKFKESVVDHHFYELMRQYSNNLEKENTLLMVMGFSFADEHIADITRRAAFTNPTLHVVVFAFDDDEGVKIKDNLRIQEVCPNNNVVVFTPTSFKEINKNCDKSQFKSFSATVDKFKFTTINSLFELIAKGINIHDKK